MIGKFYIKYSGEKCKTLSIIKKVKLPWHKI